MSADIKLEWEWPAERQLENRVLVRVNEIKPEGNGLFGLKSSPSLATSFPEPTVLTGFIVKGGEVINGKEVELVLPKVELEQLKVGQLAMLGIVNSNICICVKKVESESEDLETIKCD